MRFSGAPAKATAVLSAPLAVLTACSLVGTVLAPHLLVANPLLLVVLAPRTLYLTVAAGRAPLGLFLVVGLLRLAAADPSHYLLGRLHGPRLTELAGRRAGGRRALALVLRAWHRIGLPIVALSPSGKFLVLAGASGMPHRRVAGVALGGTLVQLLVIYAAGRAAAGPSEALASLASDHAVALVPVTAAVTLMVLGRAGLRRRPTINQSVGNQPAGDQPAGDQPAGDQPVGNQSAGNQPAGDQPAGNQSAGDQSAGNQSAGNQSAGDEGGLPGMELDAAAMELLEQHPLAPCAP